jgi:chromate transporter
MSAPPTFGEALKVWARIGLLSFGGPAAQIALMHRMVVDERRWLAEDRFLQALNVCMLLPGPEAMQLATYVGWTQHGIRGGLAAGLLFVLPGAIVVLALSMIYVAFGEVPLVDAAFFGIKAAVLAIVVEALVRIGRRALKSRSDWLIAALAFLSLFAFAVPFPLVIASAAAIGWILGGDRPAQMAASLPPRSVRASAWTAIVWLLIWLLPVAVLWAMLGQGHIVPQIALFFSKLAVLTFGGAYAVLAYMADVLVDDKGWLSAREMIDGLGLAETTPGPLILVIEYVGYVAGHRFAGGVLGGIAGAVVALWVTFAPCFLWIFLIAPYLDRLRAVPRLAGTLAAITAAVVGVILNLSLWFGLHVLFAEVTRIVSPPLDIWVPGVKTLDVAAVSLLALACLLLLWARLGVPATLAVTSLAGVALRFLV